jgi:hypothetical protein
MNGSSRIAWSALMDKYGFRPVYGTLCFIQSICAICIYKSIGSDFMYTFFVALSFFCEGGHFSLFPACAVKVFGNKNGGQISSFNFYLASVSAMSSPFFLDLMNKDY